VSLDRDPPDKFIPRHERNISLNAPADVQTIVDPKDAAESVGLKYVSDARPGIRRRKSGKGFTYTRADSSRLAETDVLRRIRSPAIPPAWTDVWICPFAGGHIQATGRDAKGRKQYRYHPRFREVRESTKYEHVVAFAEALPGVRAKVREHNSGGPVSMESGTMLRRIDAALEAAA
jgi:DNA topoisomerase I